MEIDGDGGVMVTSKTSALRVNSANIKMMKVILSQVGGVRIGQDMLEIHFQYLGSIINITGCTDENIIARISKARQEFARLN